MSGSHSMTDFQRDLWYGARKQSRDSHLIFPENQTGASGTGMKIAIQGEPGSFSHEAAMKLVADAVVVPFSLSADAFSALSNGAVEAAVIPIENSLAGSVSEHFDLLLAHDVKVERETLLRIRHNLIAISGTSVGEIDRVFSHPIALAQCRRFLAEHPFKPASRTTRRILPASSWCGARPTLFPIPCQTRSAWRFHLKTGPDRWQPLLPGSLRSAPT